MRNRKQYLKYLFSILQYQKLIEIDLFDEKETALRDYIEISGIGIPCFREINPTLF